MASRLRELRDSIKDFVRHRPALYFLYNLGRVLRGGQLILLDYHVDAVARYGYGKPPHAKLAQIIGRERQAYRATLERMLGFKEQLLAIPAREQSPLEPCWINNWFSGLDTAALYSLVALNRPHTYLEVGSGYSTRVARRAIRDHGLRTRIVSIDPEPRAEIDQLCDSVVRQPLEKADLGIFEQLVPGDILFIDSSHRCFTNSDVTIVFLEVLPRLQPGVLVHFHDIFLPYDYPPEWRDRYYSEQYLLAAILLAQQRAFEILLPAAFISQDADLSRVLAPLWDDARLAELEREDVPFRGRKGVSFWLRTV
jgi:hypothetical protein